MQNDKILITRPSMPPFEEYTEMIKKIWQNHWMTNMGEYHRQFESELEKFFDVPYVSLMVNGHMALEMTIQAMGFPKGSEVITTPYTFISTTHAIVRNGLKPVFCDIKLDDYTIDENKIEELITEKTVAIVPVHVYGNICNAEEIERIAFKYNLKVIYDAAHAFGEEYKGKPIETFGDASVLSFHATKVFNTIEGGCSCVHDKNLYEKLYNLKNFGIRSEELVVEVGANAKMNEFSAAMGLCNLKYFENNIKKRKRKKELYDSLLAEMKSDIKCNECREDIKYNYAYYPIIFTGKQGEYIRNKVYEELRADYNIFTRKYFYPITADQACFKNKYKDNKLENARYISDRVLMLPLYDELDEESIVYICDSLKNILSNGLMETK